MAKCALHLASVLLLLTLCAARSPGFLDSSSKLAALSQARSEVGAASGAQAAHGVRRARDPLNADFFHLPAGKAMVESGLWREQAVNASMGCANVGCVARAKLQAFDGTTELASNCKFSLHLHPTDFDDQYSGERLTYIKVNGVTVNTDCFPMVSGCNATTQAPLFSCLQDLSLDSIIDGTGVLDVEAQISDVVDECPYQGNLLSAVPMVTCLVTPKPPPPPPMGKPAMAPPAPQPRVVPVIPLPTSFHTSASLRCPTRGCTANAELRFNATDLEKQGVQLSRCLMNVRINSTDFDENEGTKEGIEFFKIDDTTIGYNISTGVNPCRSAWKGQPLKPSAIQHALLTGHDVTANASTGLVRVSAKLSPHVDECAQNGYLFDGMVEVDCTLVALVSKTNATANGTLNSTANSTASSTVNSTVAQGSNATANGTLNSTAAQSSNATANGTLNATGAQASNMTANGTLNGTGAMNSSVNSTLPLSSMLPIPVTAAANTNATANSSAVNGSSSR